MLNDFKTQRAIALSFKIKKNITINLLRKHNPALCFLNKFFYLTHELSNNI